MKQLRFELPNRDETEWELVYQSHSGPPSQSWLEPDVCDRTEQLPTEAIEAAHEAGLQAVRTQTPGVHHDFVTGLVDLLQEQMQATPPQQRAHLTELGPGYDVYRPECCANVRRGFAPAAAGVVP